MNPRLDGVRVTKPAFAGWVLPRVLVRFSRTLWPAGPLGAASAACSLAALFHLD